VRPLTANDVFDSAPNYSPNGERIAFVTERGGEDQDIYVMKADGSGERPLIESELFEEQSPRSEEHTSELQSLMRISYAVFSLKKKKKHQTNNNYTRMTR